MTVALGVFLERGFDRTSMEDLARAAQIHKSSFYHYFPGGKEEILQRGLDRALSGLFAVLDEPAAREGPAADRLQYVIRRAVEVETDLLPEVVLLLRVRGNSPVEVDALERRRTFTRRFAQLVQAGMDEGDLRSDLDAHLVARLVLGMATSMTEWLRLEGPLGAAELAATTLGITLDGLRAGPRTA
jgi:AcrR family transcriptional regulator